MKTERFGLIKADIRTDLREVRLSVKRSKDPLGQGKIERCITWALSRCRERYPDYELLIDGVSDAAAS